MNTFEISGRIGHLEQTGKTLKIAIYNTCVVRGQHGVEFKQQRVGLVTFGAKAAEIVETYAVGQEVKLGGFIRASGKYGNDLVVTRHELIVKAEVQLEEPTAEVAPEAPPELAEGPEAVVEAVAPKRNRRSRKQLAA
jgi:hypothetical protein